jgi:hypothetical protein
MQVRGLIIGLHVRGLERTVLHANRACMSIRKGPAYRNKSSWVRGKLRLDCRAACRNRREVSAASQQSACLEASACSISACYV